MKFEVSNQFCEKTVRKIYRSQNDLSLSFPSASFPIVFSEWEHWISKSVSKNYSLSWKIADEIVGHAALKSYIDKPGIVYLCFFIVDIEYRGIGLSSKFLKDVYRFVLDELSKKELWLVVDPKNKKAFNLYKKEGFKYIDENNSGYRMKKKLRKIWRIS